MVCYGIFWSGQLGKFSSNPAQAYILSLQRFFAAAKVALLTAMILFAFKIIRD